MARIRKILGALAFSVALASGCNQFDEHSKDEKEKEEKASNRNSYLKECGKRLGEYKAMVCQYEDNELLKSLGSENWCSKERYDKHEDIRELRHLARKKSSAFCNYWFSEALKSSELYNDPAGTLTLRRLKISPEQICLDSIRGNYELGSIYRKYTMDMTQKGKINKNI